MVVWVVTREFCWCDLFFVQLTGRSARGVASTMWCAGSVGYTVFVAMGDHMVTTGGVAMVYVGVGCKDGQDP